MIGQLFTQDFLLYGIRETPVWKALDESAVAAFVVKLGSVFRSYSADSVLNEAITEDEIILKVLGLLDWRDLYLRQATTSGARREDVPDLLLFSDANAKQVALKEKRDDRRYRQGIAILESKRWLRPLDRGEAVRGAGLREPWSTRIRDRFARACGCVVERGFNCAEGAEPLLGSAL